MTLPERVKGRAGRLWDWWQGTTLGRILGRSGELHLDLVGAGMAFYGLLAVFPALAALVSIYGLLSDPQEVQRQLSVVQTLMPSGAWDLIDRQLTSVASTADRALGFTVVFGVLFTLWSATKGMRSMINAMNIIHGVEERRNVVAMNLMAYGLTILVTLFGALAILVIVGVPAVIGFIGMDRTGWLAAVLPWAALAAASVAVLSLIYKVAPAQNRLPLGRVARGAVAATLLWIVASAAFTAYVSSFGTFNATYGSLGAVVVLLLWMMLSARIVLFGAVWNALALTPRETLPSPAEGRRDTVPADQAPSGQRQLGLPRALERRGPAHAPWRGPERRRR